MKKEKLAPEQEILLYEREYMTEDELSDSFAEFIRKKRKEVLSPTGKEGISIQEHADLLGLSKGMYQKILNKQKETQFRDCITKNYHERIGAGIHNGRIHIFYETYNYRVPELNEYYLFEYIDGVYRLTVG